MGADGRLAANWVFAWAYMIFVIKGRWEGGLVEEGDKKHADVMGETKLAEELGLSVGVTGRDAYAKSQRRDYSYPWHQRGFPPNCQCAGEAGDRVFSRVGWRCRPRTISELIHPHGATVLSTGRGQLKFRGAHGSLLFLFTSFPFAFPFMFM